MRSLGTIIALGLCAPLAAAQPAETPALKLFHEGKALLDASRAAEACTRFEASLELDPDAADTILDLGVCNEQLDRLATALRYYRRVKGGDDEKQATERAAVLATKVPAARLVLSHGLAPHSVVRIDGATADGDLARIELDAGHHVLEIAQQDEPLLQRTFDLADGESKAITIDVPTPAVATQDWNGSGKRVGGVALFAGGAVMIGVGMYYGHRATLVTNEINAACDRGCVWAMYRDKDAEGRADANTQYVLLAVGGAALIGGGVLYWLGMREQPSIAIAPHAGGASVTWSATW